ncbi:PIG-L family deacetylase [Acetobacteraceae bacterium KSS8]|uniref:PIG-L family deacetylase n=1 Tax=Endosaccharibacter trunci TaxID=2812733 RepID=A0ABT1W7N3_9PROT|nr:PIG-L family deacetylase [Acetobacteraceae bacterium KSS8]
MRAGDALAAFRALPVAPIGAVLPGTVLILAPHPDDESLGCGGIIAALCAAGRPPVVVVLTDGAGSHPSSPSWPPERLRAVRAQEVAQAVSLLGLPQDHLVLMNLADTRAPREGPAFERAVADLAAIAVARGCDSILSSWEHDPHGDHVAAWHIARAATDRIGARALAYPVWGWTLDEEAVLPGEIPAGWRIDVEPFLDVKARAVAAHATQHGSLITDDPDGFALPEDFLNLFRGRFETVLLP